MNWVDPWGLETVAEFYRRQEEMARQEREQQRRDWNAGRAQRRWEYFHDPNKWFNQSTYYIDYGSFMFLYGQNVWDNSFGLLFDMSIGMLNPNFYAPPSADACERQIK